MDAARPGKDLVHLCTQDRKPTVAAAGTAIFLALCVFVWGLEYKLSLYDPPHSLAHLVPIAKLLSKNEQPRIASSASAVTASRAAVPLLPRTAGPNRLLFLPSLVGLGLPAVRSWNRRSTAARTRQVQRASNFFVRPPPPFA